MCNLLMPAQNNTNDGGVVRRIAEALIFIFKTMQYPLKPVKACIINHCNTSMCLLSF